MLLADAYLDRIDFLTYLPRTDCGDCGAGTCQGFVERLKMDQQSPKDCPHIPLSLCSSFEIALKADEILPQFTCVTDPRPGPVGLVEINGRSKQGPVLVSGNHLHTQEVLTAILSTAHGSFLLLFSDTKGHTVDMAVIYKTMTADQIRRDVEAAGLLERARRLEIITPGLAEAVGHELARLTDWRVRNGPICAAELPLFLADEWMGNRA